MKTVLLKQVQAEGGRNVRVFAAGLLRGSRHENSQEDQVCWMELLPAVLGGLLWSAPASHGHCAHIIKLLGKGVTWP